jgi:hypothetical protein
MQHCKNRRYSALFAFIRACNLGRAVKKIAARFILPWRKRIFCGVKGIVLIKI